MVAQMEQIAAANEGNERNELKQDANVKKIEDSNTVDYNLDKVNKKKLQDFKEMTDYIRENGGKYKEYNEEFSRIVEERIKPFEEKIKDILNKNDVNRTDKENINLNSMTDEELAREVNERMDNQPEQLNQQQKVIAKVLDNGSHDEIEKLYEMVDKSMAEVQSFYTKIGGNVEKRAD